MSLSLLGFLTIIIFLVLVTSKRMSVMVALILVPTIFAIIAGFGKNIGPMMLEGLIQVAPTGIMIAFAVLYFGLMLDVGLFNPMISRILKMVKGDPLKVVVATAVLTMLVGLDGDGSSTFMITITAMFPVYKAMGMSNLLMAGIVALAAGVMNMIPWGGPLARAMASLNLESTQLFNPLIPVMIAGLLWVLFVAYIFGLKERKRLGFIGKLENSYLADGTEEIAASIADEPRNFWFNLLLTVLLVTALILHWLPLPILFMIAFALALVVNFPNPKQQIECLSSHAKNVVFVSTMIFAAGVFTGVLTGTKMIDEMAATMVSIIPDPLVPYLPIIVAITSMPLSLAFSADAYYFGILPVLGQAASSFGIDPAEIARAALLGQMTVGFPLSPLTAATFILLGLAKVELGEHQRFIFKWAFGTTIVMLITALFTGAITI
jgi:citrate-Mg2+:H+ or citrate-Ca2+:H+ symporter, CitMHS family